MSVYLHLDLSTGRQLGLDPVALGGTLAYLLAPMARRAARPTLIVATLITAMVIVAISGKTRPRLFLRGRFPRNRDDLGSSWARS